MLYFGLCPLSRFRRRHVIRLISIFLLFGCLLTIVNRNGVHHGDEVNRVHAPQQTCQTICAALPPIQKHESLKPVGNMTFEKEELDKMSLDLLALIIRPTSPGGSWAPRRDQHSCTETTPVGVAIIIPVRYRWHQVPGLLSQLIPLLRKQQLCYRIFIVEQTSVGPFNKGILFNAGFIEARRRFTFRCVIFHDVDLVPLNDLNPYGCDEETDNTVVHLSAGIDTQGFVLQYDTLIGGALKMSKEHYVKVNGYSNQYWEWGAEDDDMEARLKLKNISYKHTSLSVARYAAMPHVQEPSRWLKQNRVMLRIAVNHVDSDGLNNVEYTLLLVQETGLFTHFLVDFHKPDTL